MNDPRGIDYARERKILDSFGISGQPEFCHTSKDVDKYGPDARYRPSRYEPTMWVEVRWKNYYLKECRASKKYEHDGVIMEPEEFAQHSAPFLLLLRVRGNNFYWALVDPETCYKRGKAWKRGTNTMSPNCVFIPVENFQPIEDFYELRR